MLGPEELDRDYVERAEAVRLNNSSTQVYMALEAGRSRSTNRPAICSLPARPRSFAPILLLSRDITSRTFSFYYPRTRPDKKKERYAIVSSTNANWSDWADLNEADYAASKQDLVETTIDALEKYIPGIRDKD